MLTALLALSTAAAGYSDCPSPYYAYTCDAGGADICTWDPATSTWACDLTVNGDDGSGGHAVVIKGFNSASGKVNDYNAFGQDGTGQFFCCVNAYDEDDPWTSDMTIELEGTSGDDILFFHYDHEPISLPFMTMPAESFVLTSWSEDYTVTATMDGNHGDDILHGADEPDMGNGVYSETLNGGSDSDEICGHDGADVLDGGRGDDDLDGGPDDDVIYGGRDADAMTGGEGDDELHGEHGSDLIYDVEGTNVATGGDGDDDIVTVGIARGNAGYDQCSATTEIGCAFFVDPLWSFTMASAGLSIADCSD